MRLTVIAWLGSMLLFSGCGGGFEDGAFDGGDFDDGTEGDDEGDDGSGDGDGETGEEPQPDLGSPSDQAYCPNITCDSDCGAGACILLNDTDEVCDCNDGFVEDADGFGCVPCDALGATYDVDITLHEVSGRILFGGEAAPGSEYEDANIYLENPRHGDKVWLGNTHDDGLLSAEVTPGIYEITYELETGGKQVPQNNHAILGAVRVPEITNLQLDVEVTRVTGEITVNGEKAPSSEYDDGNIVFRQVFTGDRVAIASTHDGKYDAVLVTGTYDIIYEAENPDEIMPANSGVTLGRLEVAPGDEVHDIDIPAVTVDGLLQLDGEEPPASEYDDANVYLLDPKNGDRVWLGNTSAGSYSATVVPGDYSLLYEVETMGALMPRNRSAVVGEVTIDVGGTYDVNIPSVSVSGNLLLDGVQPPASEYDDGNVSLRNAETDDYVLLGSTSGGNFDARIIPGSYSVSYSQETAGAMLPLNKGATLMSVELEADQSFDVDLPTVALSGQITIGGEVPPEDEYADGRVLLRDTTSGDEVLLGATHEGAYTAIVLPGTYTVHYAEETAGDGVPQNLDAPLEEVVIGGPMSLNIDIPAVDLNGSFLVASDPAPSSPQQTGTVYLRSGTDLAQLGATHEGGYGAQIVPGGYSVYYRHEAGDEGLPDNSAGRVGCFSVP